MRIMTAFISFADSEIIWKRDVKRNLHVAEECGSRTAKLLDLKDATPIRTEREAQAVKGQVKGALGVSKGIDGLFYIAR
jgi:hypothetical protein